MALARLALANGQASAANAADYLQKHMRVMLAHLNRPGILDIEIKMLTSADRLDQAQRRLDEADGIDDGERAKLQARSEEHTSELQSLMSISYAVFCLKKKKKYTKHKHARSIHSKPKITNT